MSSLLLGCAVIVAGAVSALLFGRWKRLAAATATLTVWVGCLAAGRAVLAALGGAAPAPVTFSWNLPLGAFSVGMDGLSAFFMLPLLLLAPLCALYGCAYLDREPARAGLPWFFYNLLIAAMMLLLSARDGFLFLLAWEMMAVSSFFLVVADDRSAAVRQAGWTYLVAAHLGSAALLVYFILLGKQAGGFGFDGFAAAAATGLPASGLLFALALIGFGSKAGILPMHVWLPEAHPAAPSHVSAIMSGVMIKMGIYGLLRAVSFGAMPPPAAWGWILLAAGLASGIIGVLLAIAQHDLKRLLAYHSVENIGIICLGAGAGLLGLSWRMPLLAGFGLGGALLHVLNHALFKGLLFLGAGSVVHATGTRDMDRLGGLIKTMPWTGAFFLAGAAAISALPPFNGFVSEFLIYAAGIHGAQSGVPRAVLLSAAILAGLALIGGLAAACFTKCFGLVFLGEKRDPTMGPVHEAPWAMRLPMAVLAAACLAIGLAAPFALTLLAPAIGVVAGPEAAAALFPAGASKLLATVSGIGLFLLAATAAGLLWRRRAVRRAEIEGTWDCGYACPTARMQYTASSYAQPLVDLFRACLGTRRQMRPVAGYFPAEACFASHTPDPAREWFFAPLFRFIARRLSPLLILQHGRVHIYILYMAVTLIALLIWKGGV